MAVNIKKGDQVRVIAGRDKGVEGKVIEVLPEAERVIVEGVNRVRKHTRSAQAGGPAGSTGGIVTAEAPVHVSNVALVVEKDGEKLTSRIGFRRDEVKKKRADGTEYSAFRSVRVARATGEEI